MKTYIKEAIPVTHDEWLKQRSKGLGGSDAGAVMGLKPYKSAYTLWAEKTGLVSSYVPENEAIRLGNDLEEYVAKRFTEQTGKKVRRSKYCYQSKEFPFMRANVDREIVGENAVLECKTANPFKDADYSQDVIPPHYYCQCLHYIATRHLDRVYLAVLVFQRGFYTYCIDRKDPGVEEDLQALIQTESEFWNHVISGVPPQVDGSESTTNTLKQLHQSDETRALDLCDYDDKLDEIQELKDRQKHLKERQKTLENEIKEALQNYDFGRSSIYNVSAKLQSQIDLIQAHLKKKIQKSTKLIKKSHKLKH